jgi:hypothetical protein
MPRGTLLRSGRQGDPVFWIAFGISTLFVVAQISFAIAYVPVMLFAYEKAGLDLPWLLSTADRLGVIGIPLFLAVADALVFAVFVVAARRYWMGLVFVPPLLYLLAAFALFASGISGAAVVFLR